jgi:hypothetical protein
MTVRDEKLKRMAMAAGISIRSMVDMCVDREWERQTKGLTVDLDESPPEFDVPACLDFDPRYRSTARAVRDAVGALLPGRELGKALRERGCVRKQVYVDGRGHDGWHGVRVGAAASAAASGDGVVAGAAADASTGQLGALNGPSAFPSEADVGAVAEEMAGFADRVLG